MEHSSEFMIIVFNFDKMKCADSERTAYFSLFKM